MSRLPLGIQTFSEIRERNLVYVDKTDLIWELVQGTKYAFLSRPRRFGKSLLVSTLEAYFRGRTALFEGLNISRRESKWRQFPIIRIDFSQADYTQPNGVSDGLRSIINQIAENYGLQFAETSVTKFPSAGFSDLIDQIYSVHGAVVILIDEYDKALVNVLNDEIQFQENQAILANFYSVLKAKDDKIRFAFLTGVSQFAKLNIFSGLNNLTDISLEPEFANLVGFSWQEMKDNLAEELRTFQQSTGMPTDLFREEFRLMYNGYSWNGIDFLHNPFSVLSALRKKRFNEFWFITGSPTFLTQLVRSQAVIPEDLAPYVTSNLIGRSSDPTRIPLPVLLFQTGYLTIKKRVTTYGRDTYTLDYPNQEVRNAFFGSILAEFAYKSTEVYEDIVRQTRDHLWVQDFEQLFATLQRVFADIPARLHLPFEAYYHSMIYLFLRMVGFRLTLERETSKGRIDGIMQFAGRTYIIEFKFAKTGKPETLAERALQQIHQNDYPAAFLDPALETVLLGIGVVKKDLVGRHETLPPGAWKNGSVSTPSSEEGVNGPTL